jgi:uncharacterized protein YacL
MWILKWLPDWLFYGILLIGLVGFFVTYLLKYIPLPAIYMYKTPIQMVSLVFIVFGVFMAGAIHNEEAWLARVRELEAKVAEAQVKSAEENVKIIEKITTKTQVIKEKGDNIVKYIDREVIKHDSTCAIPKEFVKAHNDAAEPPK